MDNMDYGSRYDVVDQDGSHMVPEPTVKDFIIWLLIPSVLSFFTCGIGSLILLIVWACSGSNRVRSNFAKAQLSCDADFPCAGVLRLYLFRRCPDRYKRSFLNSDQSGRARLGAFCRI